MSLLFTLLFLPLFASAHQIGGSGLGSGITHPLFGIDHLLAMIAVGIIAMQLHGAYRWIVPGIFVSVMLAGGLIALYGIALPAVESWIALSVLLFGAMIAFAKVPKTAAVACVGLFALFHGHAHGTEIPLIANPALYAVGFVLSTVLLHVTGILIGLRAKESTLGAVLLRASGVAMSLFGLFFLFF